MNIVLRNEDESFTIQLDDPCHTVHIVNREYIHVSDLAGIIWRGGGSVNYRATVAGKAKRAYYGGEIYQESQFKSRLILVDAAPFWMRKWVHRDDAAHRALASFDFAHLAQCVRTGRRRTLLEQVEKQGTLLRAIEKERECLLQALDDRETRLENKRRRLLAEAGALQ